MKQKELHEWFDFDPETGEFTWKKRPSQAVKVGDKAGSMNKTRYGERKMLCIRGRRFYASRAAWVYVNGDIPNKVLVDHINGDTTDDRICNLRVSSFYQNAWNRVSKDGAKYKRGVSRAERGRFRSAIQLPGQSSKFSLGTWDTEDEAHAAYMGAAAILHGEFWIGRRKVPDLEHTGAARQRARATKAQGRRE